jgi:hypothetical protein
MPIIKSMDIIIKNLFIKLYLIPFIIFTFTFVFERNADARFIKKISVATFSDPANWEKPFKPGIVFSNMLTNSLAISGNYQIVSLKKSYSSKTGQLSEINNEETVKNKFQNKKASLTSEKKKKLSQYQIHGDILILETDTNPLKDGYTKKEAKFHRERAFIEARIELVNIFTGRLLAKKVFTVNSNSGRIFFDKNFINDDYKSKEFKSHSTGIAFWKLNDQVKSFINEILNGLPIEGDLISVDNKNNTALINLGKRNGVQVQDIFTVFSIEPTFNDPLGNVDLGDKYTRKGIIKVSEVQGRFSKGQIITGMDFIPGDRVVPKIKESNKEKLEGRSHQKDIIWGPFMGLPSLSY